MNYYALAKNNNEHSPIFGKYTARPVYPDEFVDLNVVAEFIQEQASVKRSDCKAVIDEMGKAIKHFLGMGCKVKIDGLGIFKPGLSSKAVNHLEDWNQAEHLKSTKLLFTPDKIKVGKKKVAEAISEVTWQMRDVALDSKGNPLYGAKAVREAKKQAEQPTPYPSIACHTPTFRWEKGRGEEPPTDQPHSRPRPAWSPLPFLPP